MKKILALLLAVVMVAAFASCGGKTTGDDKDDTKAADFKIGLICLHDENSTYDNNFIQALKSVQKELNLTDDQVLIKTNIGEDDSCYTAAAELVDKGCKVIFADSFGHESYVLQAAKEFKDVQFCHATGYQGATDTLDNTHNYFAKIFEARYLAGIAAGLKTETNKLGYVAAFPFAEGISGYTAFYLGAKSVNPDVTMDIMYTNSWNDPTIESQVAKALIDRGCDVISQHSDSTAPATTAEDNGVWQVGYNNDMIAAAPNASLVSPRIDWGIYVTEAVQAVIDGKEIPADWCKGYADGAVYLSPLNEKIAAEGTQEAIDKAAEALKNGELFVFGGPLKGVSPDGEKIEVAEGDHFPEQEEASAPSWQYIIEGCNVVQ